MNTVMFWVWIVIGVGLSVDVGTVEAMLAFLTASVWILIDAVEKSGKERL